MNKYIQGHPDYIVNSHGQVFKVCPKSIRELNKENSHGHARVTLDGEKLYVSSLVMHAFGPPKPDPTYKIFHINGNKWDDDIKNLVWLDKSSIHRYSLYTEEYRQSYAFRTEVLGTI